MEWQAEVTGWDADGFAIAWTGWGATEDEAIQSAITRGGIVEIGEVAHTQLVSDRKDA